MSVLCVAPGCRVPGQHEHACDLTGCRGCLPAQTEVGNLCGRCFERGADALRDIPRLAGWCDPMPGSGEGGPIGKLPAESAPPLRLAVLSELGPGSTAVTDRDGDQEGELPAAVQLDGWVRDWAGMRGEDDRLPAPTLPELCRWLTARLEWAAHHHPAIGEALDEIWAVQRRLKVLAVGVDPRQWDGKLPGRCPRCKHLTAVAEQGQAVCVHPDCRAVLTRRPSVESPLKQAS